LEKKHIVLLEKNTFRDTRHKDRQKGFSCTYCHIKGHIAEDCHRRKKKIESKQQSGKQKQTSKEKTLVANARNFFHEDSGSESEFEAAYMMGHCNVRVSLPIQEVDPDMPPLASNSDSDSDTSIKTQSVRLFKVSIFVIFQSSSQLQRIFQMLRISQLSSSLITTLNFTVFLTKDFREGMMVLDNQSTVYIFRSKKLLENSAIVEAKI
jgi:hypothetical protein